MLKSLQNFQNKTGLDLKNLTGVNIFRNETEFLQVVREADCRTTLKFNNGEGPFVQFMYCPGAKIPYIRVDYMTVQGEPLTAAVIYKKDSVPHAGGTDKRRPLYEESDWSDLDKSAVQFLEVPSS